MYNIKDSIAANHLKGYSLWFAWFVCFLTTVFYCYEYILRIVPSVMITDLMLHFEVSATGFGWLSDAYLIAYTAMQLFVGPSLDYWGVRKTLLTALISCIAGSLMFVLAHGFILAFIGRLFIGFGSAFAFVGVLRMAALWLPFKYFSFFSGFTTSLGMLGAMVGDVSLAHFVHTRGWQDVIFFSAALGVLLLPLFYWFLVDKEKSVNQVGGLWQELLRKVLVVIKNKNVILAGIIGSFMFSSLSVFADIWGIRFSQSVFHLSSAAAAQVNSMLYLGWLVGGPFAGIVSEILNSRRWFISIGCLLSGTTFLFILFYPISSMLEASVLMFLFGLFSCSEVLCFVVGKEAVKEQYIATAIGTVNFIVMLGGMILLPLVSYVLSQFSTGQSDHLLKLYSISGYRYSMSIIAFGLLLSSVLALIIRKRPCKLGGKAIG